MEATALRESATAESLLLLELDNEVYGIDVHAVREVIGYRPYSAMPVGGQGIVGVLALRGAVIPVVDLRSRLGREATSPDPLAVYIILENDGKRMALLADAVLDVVSLSGDENLFPVKDPGTPVSGIVHLDGKTVALLDPTLLGGE